MTEFCKTIQLDMGMRTIELQMTPQLVSAIVESFGLSSEDEITEKHVKYYLINGMRNAVESVDASTHT